MKICAIICEYNPLHNGHMQHIRRSRELTDCDALLLVMSGNFVQRGEPAVIGKFDRAALAIRAGADAVLELPTVYALSTAERFAFGAVKILNAVPSVKYLSFGSEHGDIETLRTLAKFLSNEPPELKQAMADALKTGNSYASAKSAAVLSCLNSGLLQVENRQNAIETLCSPNSILGLEYMKALQKSASDILPVTVKREGAGYNESGLSGKFSSATAIRKSIDAGCLEDIKSAVPDFVYDFAVNRFKENDISSDALSSMILYRLRSMSAEEIGKLCDVSEGLENRIKRYVNYASNYLSVIDAIKTKRYPHARLRRIFLYALLGIDKKLTAKTDKAQPYARVLAVKQGREDVLSALAAGKLRLITRSEDYRQSASFSDSLQIDILASDIYALLNSDPKLKVGGIDLSCGLKFI